MIRLANRRLASPSIPQINGKEASVVIRNCFQFPSSFQLRRFSKQLSAARSIAFRVLLRASQASDVGSIPIARSRNSQNPR